MVRRAVGDALASGHGPSPVPSAIDMPATCGCLGVMDWITKNLCISNSWNIIPYDFEHSLPFRPQRELRSMWQSGWDELT